MVRAECEMRDDLMREAGLVVDELLVWRSETARPTLTEIEEKVLALRKRLGERMAQAILEEQAAKRPVPGPICAECGQEMHYKGEKGNRVESRVGNLAVRRGYYYCDTCRAGVFPPGRAVAGGGDALE